MKKITITYRDSGRQASGLLISEMSEARIPLNSLHGKTLVFDSGWTHVDKIVRFEDSGRYSLYAGETRLYFRADEISEKEFLDGVWGEFIIITETQDEKDLNIMKTILSIFSSQFTIWGEEEGFERALDKIKKRFRRTCEVRIEDYQEEK